MLSPARALSAQYQHCVCSWCRHSRGWSPEKEWKNRLSMVANGLRVARTLTSMGRKHVVETVEQNPIQYMCSVQWEVYCVLCVRGEQRLRSKAQRAWEEDYVGTAKNGFGAQRLCLPKQCVALNVPNSPKFTRAMISQHMYYINNSLFYISNCLIIHVHKCCNTTEVM